MPPTGAIASRTPRRRLARTPPLEPWGLAACLLVGAVGFAVLEPWHGPIILALSEQHGIDAADLPALPLIALGLVIAGRRSGQAERNRRAGRGMAAMCAIVLGATLLAGLFDPRIGAALTPTGGGTFGRVTQHVDGLRSNPVGHWTHLAVTYDGVNSRLYVDGVEAAGSSASGRIRQTSDPLWIGGNRPYGEFFRGVIDEVRVYGRALRPAEIQAAMSTPIGRDAAGEPGLDAEYSFDAGDGRTLADASGNGNTGVIRGAKWTRDGHFGSGLQFDGTRAVVRVPESASLNLTKAMTLMAWIKPSARQSGWRTVLARQTDAYFLTAGGGRQNAGLLARLDRLRFALMLLLIGALGVALARGDSPWALGDARWYWPLGLFLAGSLLDAAFTPTDTLIGPALLAIGWGAVATGRGERVTMLTLGAAFVVVTLLSIVAPAALPLPRDAGGVVRSAAVGLVLASGALLALSRARPGTAGSLVQHGPH